MYLIEEIDLRYYIDKSTIPNAGYGLFAKELLKRGDHLEVIGVVVKKGGISDKCTHFAKRYKFAAGPKFDAHIIPLGYGGLVNHTEDEKIMNCQIEHVPGLMGRSQHSGQIVYRFIRDIVPGEEIIGNYGPNVGEEIKKFSENMEFLEENKSDWDRFTEFQLYDLHKLEL